MTCVVRPDNDIGTGKVALTVGERNATPVDIVASACWTVKPMLDISAGVHVDKITTAVGYRKLR